MRMRRDGGHGLAQALRCVGLLLRELRARGGGLRVEDLLARLHQVHHSCIRIVARLKYLLLLYNTWDEMMVWDDRCEMR